MITELRLQNFRCFDDHTVPFNQRTIIVGRNNAGKSTIVEALRLISVVVNRYQALTYQSVPDWLDLPRRMRGVRPNISDMEFSLESTFNHYSEPPAIITAIFNNGSSVSIYLGREGKIHAVITGSSGRLITSRYEANNALLPKVSIMPQAAPVSHEEILLTPEYVRRAMSSPLAPSHFRNQLKVLYQLFPRFQKIAEQTWPGLRILELVETHKLSGDQLTLLVQNEGFVADVGSMGHGLQMWLQAMWFLVRSENDPTIILDEPDVYMHADLQRRLIRYLRTQRRQIIVTTHSIEIMAEVDPEDILVIERNKPQSRFTSTLPAVQRLVEYIGSVHNIHLARLWSSHRCIFVEGKDIKLLKHFQNVLFPESSDPFDAIPNMAIGGWSGWNYAVGSSLFLKNAGGERIIIYCIFDRDYHTEAEIAKRKSDAKSRGVQLHIWSKKEIENYVVIPELIERVIRSRVPKRTSSPSLEEIVNRIEEIMDSLKDDVFDALSSELLAQAKDQGPKKANQAAREIIKRRWTSFEGKLSLVSGKELITRLSSWSQNEFGVQLNAVLLARNLKANEMPEEIATVVTAIENGDLFP